MPTFVFSYDLPAVENKNAEFKKAPMEGGSWIFETKINNANKALPRTTCTGGFKDRKSAVDHINSVRDEVGCTIERGYLVQTDGGGTVWWE